MDPTAKNSTNNNKCTKADTFTRIAEKRTERVLDSLRLLGQCSNRRSYEYTDEQVAKIFKEIRSAVRRAQESFRSTNKHTHFKL